MTAASLGAQCHVLECAEAVAFLCASCGRACCDSHGCTVSIVRRSERLETPGHRWMLERVPTHTETYAMCQRCAKKPITLKV